MKRKIIKQGHNTLTVTLPKKWCDFHNLKGGNEIEVLEEDEKIIVTPQENRTESIISIDITGMDRCSILYAIRNAYRMGYNEISLKFDNSTTQYYEFERTDNVLSIIHYEVDHLVGVEIISQTKNSCIIRDLSSPHAEEFDPVLRRIFLVLINAAEELTEGMKASDYDLVKTTEEKHNTITKFASYCLRMINQGLSIGYKQHTLIYHIIANLDKIADVMKYTARSYNFHKKEMGPTTLKLLNRMVDSLRMYYEFFYKGDTKKAVELDKNRGEILRLIREKCTDFPKEEMLILTNLEQMLELLADLVVARMGLN
ncbi:AbrB/MazE/SpoVT family DNA-binding domain-containing protein [Pseudomonadota bacterium]